ncbi:MAG: D-glycero-beta-D-manno-heptose 1-phosphate adenylyltransferase [Chloracidobacterium sp.]|uniref:D-glycero-beta-D-manno-heptose 1-phosphate adenylyltransferase n=1 Tax=Chloracidobacterium validum TaxID=2821543 RepID=A0ABX8B8W9_9BACT|nr:D-glycero-beta-D-manno-heptose 1-phosphate adenylyltransferase [Chloracidobacterium validum]QUW03383.1 D-glycero-beta-D-manno-heptose 1-phosphate adenylyltransferase [Chloracidobacterium validum]
MVSDLSRLATAAARTPNGATPNKRYALPDLVAQRDVWRRAGLRVVFTNGCFDLLHPGHVAYLRHARQLGDVLIVALNSDHSIHELKGDTRPILTEDERCQVMAALEMVDAVTVFDAPTPLAVIEALLPDVLVKGGDWAIEQIVGREVVEAQGGVVCALPFVPGISTTEIIQRILARHPHAPSRRL